MTDRTKIERVSEDIAEAEKLFGFDARGSVGVMIAAQMIQAERLHHPKPEIPAGKALVDIDVMAQMKVKDEEIAVLKERLERKRRIHESVDHEESAAYRRLNQLLHDATAGAFLPAAAADEIERQREEIAMLREALRRLAFAEVEIESRSERVDVHNAAILLSDPVTIEMSGTLVQESAQRGLAALHEAAKVGR